jgi:hypothetical protein
MKYLQGAVVMLISNLLSIHINGLGVNLLMSGLLAVVITISFVFVAHFIVNLLTPKRAEG